MKWISIGFIVLFFTACSFVAIRIPSPVPKPIPPRPIKTNEFYGPPAPVKNTNETTIKTNKPITLLSAPRVPILVSNTTLRLCLSSWRINPTHLIMADESYTVIPTEYVDRFNDGFKIFIASNNLVVYASEKNDCDDIARTYSFYCRASIRDNTNYTRAPAVADVYFNSPGGAHAVCMFFTYNTNNQFEPVFIDPFIDPFIPSMRFSTNSYKSIWFLNM